MVKKISDIPKNGNKFALFEEIFGDIFIEDGMIIRPDGNISVGFKIDFKDRESQSEEGILQTLDSIIKVCSRLPDNTTVHFQGQYYYSKNSLEALRKSVTSFLVKKLVNHLLDRPKLDYKCFLYLTFCFDSGKLKNPASTWLATFGLKRKDAVKNVESNKIKVKGLIQTFLVQMKGVEGMMLSQLNTVGLQNERKRYFNFDFSNNEPIGYTGDIANNGHSVVVGDKVATTIHLKEPGNILHYTVPNDRQVHSYMAWPMGYYLPFPHLVNLSFTLVENQALLKRLDSVKNTSTALGSMQKQADRIIANDIEAYTQEIRQSNTRVCVMNHNILVWDSNPDRLAYNVDMVRTAYTRMNGSFGIVDPFNAGNNFVAFSPGMASDMFDTLIMSVEDALLHFDYSKPVAGDQRGIILCNRDLEPIMVDLWHESLVNKNIVAIGPSGSGKSFFFNFLLNQTIEQGNEVVILDVGGSYRNLFQINPIGVYKDYGANSKFSFNPFLIPTDDHGKYILSQDKIVFLLSLLTILWKDTNNKEKLSREEESVLSELLLAYYNKVNAEAKLRPRLDRFVEYVAELIKEVVKNPAQNPTLATNLKYFKHESFILVLNKFTHGQYKDSLNSEENENIAINRLICFDLQGLQSDPILYPVVSLIIIELVLDKIKENPKVRKQIVIDEAWTMLQGTLSSFIENLFRTVRKAGGSVCIITQSIIELKSSPVGEALKANAAIKILLDHGSQVALIPDIQSFFGLTDGQTELLRSIRQGDGWREVFVMRNDEAQVFAVDVGKHNAAAFSSKAEDRDEIKRLSKIAGPEYAVNQFVENNSK